METLEQEFKRELFLHKCKIILEKGMQYYRDIGKDENKAIDDLVDILDIQDNRETFNRLYEEAINNVG